MFSTRSLFAFFAFLTTVFSLVAALPIELSARDVWTPPVTNPTATTVWEVGTTQTVTWDTSSKPTQVTNPIGQIWLRHNGSTLSSGPGSIEEPLASGFPLTDGQIEIVVPDIEPDNTYQIVLFGDSGNFSPLFAIASAPVDEAD